MKLSDLEQNNNIVISEGRSFVDLLVSESGVGKIVKGVNTTVDVGVDEIPRQAAKWGFKVSKTGVPPIMNANGTIGQKKGALNAPRF